MRGGKGDVAYFRRLCRIVWVLVVLDLIFKL